MDGIGSIVWKAARLVIGFAFIGLGVVMIFTPGPGLLCIFFGVAIAFGKKRAKAMLGRVKAEAKKLRDRWRNRSS